MGGISQRDTMIKTLSPHSNYKTSVRTTLQRLSMRQLVKVRVRGQQLPELMNWVALVSPEYPERSLPSAWYLGFQRTR